MPGLAGRALRFALRASTAPGPGRPSVPVADRAAEILSVPKSGIVPRAEALC